MKKIFFSFLIIIAATISIMALPAKVELKVPFLCQAPYADWSQPWQDACEEAAIIMAMRWAKGDQVTRASGNREILALVDFQVKKYGGHYDLTAEQSARLIKDYYGYNRAEVLYDVSVENIKKELARGNLVIAPMAGRLLKNPFYTPPGPAYHYILFTGFDDRKGEFITNDAGTKRGKGFRYKYSTAYDAIHDWTGSQKTITGGRKAAVILFL